MALFETSKKTKLYQEVANIIVDKLQNNEYKIGDKLPSERTLAETLSVSRATIREAIIALEILGYVEIQTGSGIYVTAAPNLNRQVSSEAFNDDITPYEFLEMRLLVEPEFASLAAAEVTDNELSSFRELQRKTKKTQSLREYYAFDKEFHHLIAQATKNILANTVLKSIWEKSEQSLIPENFNKHFVSRKSWEISLKEHDNIIKAIIERDPKMANYAMKKHLLGVILRLRQDF